MKISKPKILISLPLAFFSFEAYLSALFGYFSAKLLSGKKTGQQGIIKSIIFNIGKYKIHLHHWLLSLGIMISSIIFNFYFFSPKVYFGFLTGVVFQGISYPDWHKILMRVE